MFVSVDIYPSDKEQLHKQSDFSLGLPLSFATAALHSSPPVADEAGGSRCLERLVFEVNTGFFRPGKH